MEAPAPLTGPAPGPPPRPRATWRWWEALAVFALAILAGGILGGAASALVSGENVEFLMVALMFQVSLAAATMGWIWLLHRPAVRAIGAPENPVREVGAGIAGGLILRVGLLVVVPVLVLIIEALTGSFPEPPDQLPSDLADEEFLLASFPVTLLAPVAEELFFRAFLFGALRARRGFLFAAGVSSVAFGASHLAGLDAGSFLLASVLVLVGFGLAFVYERRRNILAPMAAHATFNVIGLLLIFASQR